jgi:protocatechuate 3,4-dioxygenase beta subunit
MSELNRRTLLTSAGALAIAGCNLRIEDADYCLVDNGIGALINEDSDFPDPGECQTTAFQIEGPFYSDGAPFSADLVTGEGVIVTLSGRVFESGCVIPVANATVEIWHTDDAGDYDNNGYGYRTALVTDSDGNWALRTIRPGRYPNGGVYRPRHYHVKITVEGIERLVTQLYFKGDEYLDCDPYANTSLIVPFDGNETDGLVGEIDFVLA